MKPIYIVLASIGAIILFSFLGYRSLFNNAVGYQETVDEKWSNVQSAYQRRADLIPALVKQVKAGSKNEREILTQVTQARAGIVNAKTPNDLELMGRKINTAINLAYEAYPQLTSTKLFVDFGNAVEGSENRINYARDEYNGSVKTYNTHIRSFFASMLLNRGEFGKKEGFKANAGSQNAPDFELE